VVEVGDSFDGGGKEGGIAAQEAPFVEARTNCFLADDMAFASQIIDELADSMTLLNKA
jgi:hypothetical protein